MSILPKPTRAPLAASVTVWAQSSETPPWDMRRWIVDCRSINDLFEFIAAQNNQPYKAELNTLAQQQIQTLMAAETHEQLRALRAPPVLKDPRTYVAFVTGAFAGWLANILTAALQ
jgi:hypothetical protein